MPDPSGKVNIWDIIDRLMNPQPSTPPLDLFSHMGNSVSMSDSGVPYLSMSYVGQKPTYGHTGPNSNYNFVDPIQAIALREMYGNIPPSGQQETDDIMSQKYNLWKSVTSNPQHYSPPPIAPPMQRREDLDWK